VSVQFTLGPRVAGDVAILSVAGEVDLATVGGLRQAVSDLLAQRPARLVLDLSEVSFIDSTGLGVLIGARKRAIRAGVSLGVVCSNTRILRIFAITGLRQALDVHDTLASAVAPPAACQPAY